HRYSAAAWPLVCEKQRLPRKVFRRSIAWLSDSRSTLRRLGYPSRRKTRFQPLVRRYWAGFYPQGSNGRFPRVSLHLILLPQALLAPSTSTAASNRPATHREHRGGSLSARPVLKIVITMRPIGPNYYCLVGQ